jgi:hypothetical protein
LYFARVVGPAAKLGFAAEVTPCWGYVRRME